MQKIGPRKIILTAMARSVDTSFGKISYIDEGTGEPFLIVHGITVFFSGGGHLMKGNSEEINNVLDEFVEAGR